MRFTISQIIDFGDRCGWVDLQKGAFKRFRDEAGLSGVQGKDNKRLSNAFRRFYAVLAQLPSAERSRLKTLARDEAQAEVSKLASPNNFMDVLITIPVAYKNAIEKNRLSLRDFVVDSMRHEFARQGILVPEIE